MRGKLVFILVFVPFFVFGHEKEDHSKQMQSGDPGMMSEHSDMQEQMGSNQIYMHLEKINTNYRLRVRSIIVKKCFDCHGILEKMPWYYAIPGIKQIIDYDIKEAKKHLNMSHDFPFEGHGTPLTDLEAMKRVAVEEGMPPFRYWIVQPGSRLTKEDKDVIINWVDESKFQLSQ